MTVSPVLIVLRGNSGSGKSSVARELRGRYGYGLAWIEQDYIRRTLLREADLPGGKNIDLIALNVQYALAAGYHVVLEGILQSAHYAAMLKRLQVQHAGASYFYYFDLPFEETVRRHATRPQAREFSVQDMQGWFQQRDLLKFVPERTILSESSLEETVRRILTETALSPGHRQSTR